MCIRDRIRLASIHLKLTRGVTMTSHCLFAVLWCSHFTCYFESFSLPHSPFLVSIWSVNTPLIVSVWLCLWWAAIDTSSFSHNMTSLLHQSEGISSQAHLLLVKLAGNFTDKCYSMYFLTLQAWTHCRVYIKFLGLNNCSSTTPCDAYTKQP